MTTNAAEELAPCPFCGGKPMAYIATDLRDKFDHWTTIKCEQCGCEQSEEYTSEAITAWNTRHTQADNVLREALNTAYAWAMDDMARHPDETGLHHQRRAIIRAALKASPTPEPNPEGMKVADVLREAFEVRPCADANGNRTSWDICYPSEPDATGVGVVASCYGTREQAETMAAALKAPTTEPNPLDSYEKFDGVGPHAETIETRARIGERYLEAYDSALSDPRIAGYCPADCPSELLLDLLDGNRLSEPNPEGMKVAERVLPACNLGCEQNCPADYPTDLCCVTRRAVAAMQEASHTMKFSRVFIGSREKMHPDGQSLYDAAWAQLDAALLPLTDTPSHGQDDTVTLKENN